MSLKLARVLSTTAAVVALTAASVGEASAGVPAGAAPALCSTSAVISINSFVFNPASVVPGQSSTASLAATNCTGVSQTVTETWYGRFEGPTTGIPAGCPAVDPFPRSVTFAPHASVTTSTGYLVFSGCTATDLAVTVKITGAGGVLLAQRTAVLQIV